MQIIITTGVGRGPTTVSAFDAALMDAGITHWNLIPLSSVIPTGAEMVEGQVTTPESEFGQRRYVVMARAFATGDGQSAWAGLGWCQDASGRGLLVELTGTEEQALAAGIQTTLDSMKARRSFPLGPGHHKCRGVTWEGEPACAVVIAVFPGTGPWPA